MANVIDFSSAKRSIETRENTVEHYLLLGGPIPKMVRMIPVELADVSSVPPERLYRGGPLYGYPPVEPESD